MCTLSLSLSHTHTHTHTMPVIMCSSVNTCQVEGKMRGIMVNLSSAICEVKHRCKSNLLEKGGKKTWTIELGLIDFFPLKGLSEHAVQLVVSLRLGQLAPQDHYPKTSTFMVSFCLRPSAKD